MNKPDIEKIIGRMEEELVKFERRKVTIKPTLSHSYEYVDIAKSKFHDSFVELFVYGNEAQKEEFFQVLYLPYGRIFCIDAEYGPNTVSFSIRISSNR